MKKVVTEGLTNLYHTPANQGARSSFADQSGNSLLMNIHELALQRTIRRFMASRGRDDVQCKV